MLRPPTRMGGQSKFVEVRFRIISVAMCLILLGMLKFVVLSIFEFCVVLMCVYEVDDMKAKFDGDPVFFY